MRRLRIKNITKPMLAETIRSYVRASPHGIPGTPSAEGIKNILEYELRIPMKLDKPLAADIFFRASVGGRSAQGVQDQRGEPMTAAQAVSSLVSRVSS
jgi:hypothetical protein